uniref:ZXD family zinc finger C n=2 Tax=Colobus angolensis palliatus TaxID=336983 RepID=A0A2K5H6X7_COLAP
MKAHMVRQHSRRQDLLPQLEAPSSLTPSSELSSPGQSELTNMDLAALFSDTPANASGSAGGSDEALNSGILTIDVTSVSSSLGGNLPASNSSLGPMEPLVLVAHSDIPPSLDSPLVLGTAATVLQQGSFSVDDVQTVSAGALGCLVALPMKNLSDDPLALTSSSNLAHITTPTSSSTPQENASVPELLAPIKVEPDSPSRPGAVGQQEGSHGLPQSTLSSPAERHGAQNTELSAGTGNFYLESGGSARTDYRAIQLAKEKKQRGAGSNAGASQSTQRKIKEGKMSPPHFHASQSSWLCGSLVVPSRGRPGPAPAAGVQCGAQGVQVQLVQDDPSGEGVLPSTHGPAAFLPFLTVDLPVYVLQEVLPSSGGPSGPEATQFPGSTINLQDLQ